MVVLAWYQKTMNAIVQKCGITLQADIGWEVKSFGQRVMMAVLKITLYCAPMYQYPSVRTKRQNEL